VLRGSVSVCVCVVCVVCLCVVLSELARVGGRPTRWREVNETKETSERWTPLAAHRTTTPRRAGRYPRDGWAVTVTRKVCFRREIHWNSVVASARPLSVCKRGILSARVGRFFASSWPVLGRHPPPVHPQQPTHSLVRPSTLSFSPQAVRSPSATTCSPLCFARAVRSALATS
jgi:hypothetical protein